MKADTDKKIYLSNYTPPDFLIKTVDLTLDLSPDNTIVTSRLSIIRNGVHQGALILNGEGVTLKSVKINDEILAQEHYQCDDKFLTIPCELDVFSCEIITEISPRANTQLEGLFLSKNIYCTQCEAEGFRRITYFLDRPDILSIYTVSIISDADYPTLLSNGNLLSYEQLDTGKIKAVWHDPFAKPCYLFALVAGDLAKVTDNFTTMSNKNVQLNIHVAKGYEGRCAYAMDALKRAMRWDEVRFGLEYDLDVFHIVAIEDFNMGAMENKSLNIFNAKYILADIRTATDADYGFIESIVAHEYFHNWTGNRVTCRDWFQLSLKEGLTVFRDQEFTADERSAAVKRIDDILLLKTRQFPEDLGALSHPVRPESYIEINNFYTLTIYEKGAEIIRMIHGLLGEEIFQKGMRRYFQLHDGKAATCDDFIAAMQDAAGSDSGIDFTHFKEWYNQSGVVHISYKGQYDKGANCYHLHLHQHTPPTPNQQQKVPLYVPLDFALLNDKGEKIPYQCDDASLRIVGDRSFIILNASDKKITFFDIHQQPYLSINRQFSAPIIIENTPKKDVLAFHQKHDDDPYIKWQAGQDLAIRIVKAMIAGKNIADIDEVAVYMQAFAHILRKNTNDVAFQSLLLSTPSDIYIGETLDHVLPEKIYQARQNFITFLANEFHADFDDMYHRLGGDDASLTAMAVANRRGRNLALFYLSHGEGEMHDICARLHKHYFNSNNMTNKIAAMATLASFDKEGEQKNLRGAVFNDFFEQFKDDDIVLDKWFSLQAMDKSDSALENIRLLTNHPLFSLKNPNRMRSVLGVFAGSNMRHFHHENGKGYDFILSFLPKIDALNPQTAARLSNNFAQCRRLAPSHRQQAEDKLKNFMQQNDLSEDTKEILEKIIQ